MKIPVHYYTLTAPPPDNILFTTEELFDPFTTPCHKCGASTHVYKRVTFDNDLGHRCFCTACDHVFYTDPQPEKVPIDNPRHPWTQILTYLKQEERK